MIFTNLILVYKVCFKLWKQRPSKDGIVRRAVTLGRCVLVARGAGRGAVVIVARAYCRPASICQHCVPTARDRRTYARRSNFRISNAVDRATNSSRGRILIVFELLFCVLFFICVCWFFFGLFDDDCEAKEIMPKSLCDWTLVFICSWVVFFIFVSPFGFAADFFWCHKQREEQW